MTGSRAKALVALVAIAACKAGATTPHDGTDAAPPTRSMPSPPTTPPTTPTPTPTPTPPATPPTPTDARLQPILANTRDCYEPGIGFASYCGAAKRISNLAAANSDDTSLAASCGALLAGIHAPLGAACLAELATASVEPYLPALLDAMDRESNARTRETFSYAVARGDARRVGVEPRVIALVRTLVADPEGYAHSSDWIASRVMSSLFQSTPSREAGDLALDVVRTGGTHVKMRAFHAVAQLTDRSSEVCARMTELAIAGDLVEPVTVIARLGSACTGELDPVIDELARAMVEKRFDIREYLSTNALLAATPLTTAQVQRLRQASASLPSTAPEYLQHYANVLVRRLARYRAAAR